MLEPSVVVFYEKDLSKISKVIFVVFRALGFIRVTEKLVEEVSDKKSDKKSSQMCYESSNFTIINFYLIKMGPTREGKLTTNLLLLQVSGSVQHFLILLF